MIISVTSGKGGTGKTTVATNLAFSIGKGVKILDCDVEEPNSHLFLHPEIKEKEKIFTWIPEVDEEKCTLCRKCVDICRFRAIMKLGETVMTFPELCHSCGGCLEVCPEGAIKDGKRELGVLQTGYSGDIEFVHGRLRIGEAMSPPLIKKVRFFADPDKVNIIDSPPGTSCPVIAAMKGADFVLLVTEPTPFGLHDLKLANEAVKILNIPRGLVINRSDLGDRKVWDYAEKDNLPVLMEIPFDRRIAEAYSRGKIASSVMTDWKDKFNELLVKIKTITESQ